MTKTKQKVIDLSLKMNELVQAIAQHVPRLKHVASARIAFFVQFPRGNARGPFEASIRPKCRSSWEKHTASSVPYLVEDKEYDYLLFVNHRIFIETPNIERLRTIFHELWHVHPKADGRIRRAKHGKKFDRSVEFCLEQFLKRAPQKSYVWITKHPRATLVRCQKLVSLPDNRARTILSWSDHKIAHKQEDWFAVLEKYGKVHVSEQLLDPTSINNTPPYLYTCPKRHRVRRWGKFKQTKLCPTCHKKGTRSILVFKE